MATSLPALHSVAVAIGEIIGVCIENLQRCSFDGYTYFVLGFTFTL